MPKRRRPQLCDCPHTCSECGCPFLGKPKQLTCSAECKKIRQKANIDLWRIVNAGYIRWRTKIYYGENPERQKITNARWKAANPEKFKASQRASGKRSYAKQPEKHRAVTREYLASNPDLQTFYSERAKLRRRKAVTVFKRLAEVNPKVYDEIADVRDKGRAMLRALKEMGIEIAA